MKRTRVWMLLFLTIALSLCGCQANAQAGDGLPEVQARKIIIDTDTGADDAAAMIMAALQTEIEILGVTVVSGNVSLEQAAQNALMSLEIAGRTDVPVYCGAKGSIVGAEYDIFSVFGKDGMGDAGLIHPSGTPESGSAVDFILDTVSAFPDEVELIALGPSTNIARAIQQNPDAMKNVKRIWVMGTAGFGPGNATPVAEFNIFMDPDAFQILADSGLPITVIGLDTNVESTCITRADQKALMKGNDLQRFVGASINRYMEYNQATEGRDIAALPDPIAMACLLWDGYLLETVSCHASVITAPGETFGQVLLYRKGAGYHADISFENYNVEVASQTQSDLFKTWFMKTLENGRR